jgi:hypothetical protein
MIFLSKHFVKAFSGKMITSKQIFIKERESKKDLSEMEFEAISQNSKSFPPPKEILSGKICPYCNRKTDYIDSSIIYGSSYGMVYACYNCNAWVGVHRGTDEALGRLANKELREAKKLAHLYFDQIWQKKLLSRQQAYSWLSSVLSIAPKYTHIGMFDLDLCKNAAFHSQKFLVDHAIK